MKYINKIFGILSFLCKWFFLRICRGKRIKSLGYKTYLSTCHPSVVLSCNSDATLEIGKVIIKKDSYIAASSGGNIRVGNRCFFNRNVSIVSKKSISIGDNCSFGPNVHIYDHDHVFGIGISVKDDLYKSSEVYIGNNVWVGANAIILRGSSIGDNCVIGAGTVVKGTFPADSLIVQERKLHIRPIEKRS